MHTMEILSLKKEFMADGTVQMNFQHMLNEISQTQEDKYPMIPLK